MVELLGLSFVVFLWVIVLLEKWSEHHNHCPVCKADTVEVGYNNWKRKCMECGWNNFKNDDRDSSTH